MALTPAEIQALDAHFGAAPAPNPVANSPVGQLETFKAGLAGKESYNKKKGELEAEKDVNKPKTDAALQQQLADIERAAAAIRDTKGMIGGDHMWEAGYMGDKLKNIPTTGAYNLNKQLEQVGSGVVLDKLMQLKASSPTGASGFGALSEKEMGVLQNNLGSLDLGQGEKRLSGKVRDIYGNYNNIYKQLSGGKELPPFDQQQPQIKFLGFE